MVRVRVRVKRLLVIVCRNCTLVPVFLVIWPQGFELGTSDEIIIISLGLTNFYFRKNIRCHRWCF